RRRLARAPRLLPALPRRRGPAAHLARRGGERPRRPDDGRTRLPGTGTRRHRGPRRAAGRRGGSRRGDRAARGRSAARRRHGGRGARARARRFHGAACDGRAEGPLPPHARRAAMTQIASDKAAFVRTHTRHTPVPHAPEIALYVADEATALWEKTEEELGAMG